MEIRKLFGLKGARAAEGIAVVIDVLRAATVEAYALSKGAASVIPVKTPEEAFAIKQDHPEYLLSGEIGGYKVEGFDLGNSPSEMLASPLTGKVVVHRTSSGTQGLAASEKADRVIFGSFVTTGAIVSYIQKQNPKVVSLVAMDGEDGIFADYLALRLEGKEMDRKKVAYALYQHPGSDYFVDPTKPEFPLEDVKLALDIDRFDFVCLVEKENGKLVTKKVTP